MNYVDIIIILFIAFGFVIGFKRGLASSLISLLGYILATIVSFVLKDSIARILMKYGYIFDFHGLIKGGSVLNILLYEIISFLIVFAIAQLILRIILSFTSIADKILSFSILLSLPFKIIGGILGAIESYLIVFVVLFICSTPFFNNSVINSSKLKDNILNNTPVMTSACNNFLKASNEIYSLAGEYKEANPDKFNLDSLDILLKYKITSKDTVKELIDSNKIEIKDADSVLNKY